MALTNQANIKELSDAGTAGTRMGQTAADLVGFHGATPVAQAAAVALTTGSTIATVETAVQAIITALSNKGLLA